MKTRRCLLAGAASVALFSPLGAAVSAEWPSRPVRLICPFPAGAGVDIAGRLFAGALANRLGVNVVVENHAGAGGVIGTEYLARANRDGHTLGFVAGDSISILPAFKKSIPYAVPGEFTFIARFVETGVTITTGVNLPVKSVPELVSYARSDPGRVKAGTGGVAAAADIATYLFERSTDTKIAHIPYNGMAPAIAALLGGHIDLVFAAPSSVIPVMQSGRVRVLAVTSTERNPLIPDAPTVHELGLKTATFTNWYGLLGPANTPNAVLQRIQQEVSVMVEDRELRNKIAQAALQLSPLYGSEFRDYVAHELEAFRALGKAENISID